MQTNLELAHWSKTLSTAVRPMRTGFENYYAISTPKRLDFDPGTRQYVDTGLAFYLPRGYGIRVHPHRTVHLAEDVPADGWCEAEKCDGYYPLRVRVTTFTASDVANRRLHVDIENLSDKKYTVFAGHTIAFAEFVPVLTPTLVQAPDEFVVVLGSGRKTPEDSPSEAEEEEEKKKDENDN